MVAPKRRGIGPRKNVGYASGCLVPFVLIIGAVPSTVAAILWFV